MFLKTFYTIFFSIISHNNKNKYKKTVPTFSQFPDFEWSLLSERDAVRFRRDDDVVAVRNRRIANDVRAAGTADAKVRVDSHRDDLSK